MHMRQVANCPAVRVHISSLRIIAADTRRSYGYRTVRWSSWWTTVDLIRLKKKPRHNGTRTVGKDVPSRAGNDGPGGQMEDARSASHFRSMRRGRGRYCQG